MRQIECYFWFDGDHETLEAVIRPMCLTCHADSYPWLGWYYKGEVGPWKYVCGKCNGIILDGIADEGQPEIIE